MVVFKPDRTEITRIAGNMDLSLYAGVLDNALGDVRPVKDVIELAVKGEAPLAATIAAGSRITRSVSKTKACSSREAADRVRERRATCPAELTKERARLHIRAAAAGDRAAERSAQEGGKADKALTVLIVRVNEMLANKALALANADAVRGLRTEFFLAARQTLPQLAPTLRERWMAIADAATANPEFAPADQLAAQLMKITRGQGIRAPTARFPPTCAAWHSPHPTRCWP